VSTDNRTVINDCEQTTGWTGDDTVSLVNDVGAFYEGSNSLSWQASDASEQMSTTDNSVSTPATFSLDWSDSTLYMLAKDNLGDNFAGSGVQFVIGDATPDLIGYDVGGNDAGGLLLPTYFQCYKLDVSQAIVSPGSFTNHAGLEANLDHTAITAIGYGSVHLDKANGPSDNVFMDVFSFIANGSFALTIDGGTSGTPETMTDVVADDVTNGRGMNSNPLGDQFWFFAPTEWGESGATADHFFEASNEQWYWLGDNGGGRPIGAGNFPFRLVSNATDTGSWVVTNVVIVNTGTGADFDMSDTDFETIEMDGCTVIGLATLSAPSAGGTSRFITDTIFLQCGQITHNGASMNGCSIEESTVAADVGALFYNETADPDGETDNMTFVKGANAHHAIEFGTSAPQTMTLRGQTLEGFNASDAQNDSALLFPDTGSDVTWTISIIGGTGTFSFKKVRAGDTVNITASVGLTVTAKVGAVAVEGARVRIEETDGTLVAEGTTNASGVFSASTDFTGDLAVNVVVRLKGFLFFDAVDTITSSGLSFAAPMDPDPTVNLP
jgi:hypothetical protein